LTQSKIIVIESKSLERDAGGKAVSAFPHPASGLLSFGRRGVADSLPKRHCRSITGSLSAAPRLCVEGPGTQGAMQGLSR